jgi:hypothetical protein
MKPIHWILLAGLGLYFYSQKSKAQSYPGLPSRPGYHLVPGPDGNLIEVKNPQGSKSDEVYALPSTGVVVSDCATGPC